MSQEIIVVLRPDELYQEIRCCMGPADFDDHREASIADYHISLGGQISRGQLYVARL